MKHFSKSKKEMIFFSISLVFLIILVFYIIQSVRFLVVQVSQNVSPDGLLKNQEPVTFNLGKFRELGL